MDKHNRRRFLKKVLYGAAAAPALAKNLLAVEKPQIIRQKKGDMFYRRLGRTGLNISEISLGGSPLPDKAILHQAVERGVNYIDTSHSYSNGNSERQIGIFFKEAGRDKAYVGTKFHVRGNFDKNAIIKSVEGSLTRLQTDYMDVLLIHGVDDENHLTDERVMSAFETLKKQGKYRFRGISCHSNHHKVATKAVECGFYDMLLLGYNVFEFWLVPRLFCREALESDFGREFVRQMNVVCDHAHARGIQVEFICSLATVGDRWHTNCPNVSAEWAELRPHLRVGYRKPRTTKSPIRRKRLLRRSSRKVLS